VTPPTHVRKATNAFVVSALITLGLFSPAVAKDQQFAQGWQPIALPVIVPSTNKPAAALQVVSASVTGGQTQRGNRLWLIGGATAPAPPARRPALWASRDLVTFTPVPLTPLPGYGEIAEVFGVAALDEAGVRLGAVAQAFGGAHGNPRTASWVGGLESLAEVRTDFELYNGPRQIAVRSITTAPSGYVIFGSRVNQNGRLGAAAWTSKDGTAFDLHDNDPALSSGPNEQTQGLALIGTQERWTIDPAGREISLVAVGERLWWDPANSADTIDTDGIVWVSTDGTRWQRWSPPGFRLGGKGEQRLQQVYLDAAGLVLAGTETVNGRAAVTVWSAKGKRRIAVFGSTDDPLSGVTSLQRVGGTWYVAARVGGVLKLAASRDLTVWTGISLPVGLPWGGRAKLLVIPAGRGPLLIGASGLNGGGLWTTVQSEPNR
jgi:hypothetical protein